MSSEEVKLSIYHLHPYAHFLRSTSLMILLNADYAEIFKIN
jgi:hypothetical protein